MKNEKLGQEPAFPVETTTDSYGITRGKQTGPASGFETGMSKRFYAACAAMQGIISSLHPASTATPRSIVRDAFILADELLNQENQ
jgi:hypothetical protein